MNTDREFRERTERLVDMAFQLRQFVRMLDAALREPREEHRFAALQFLAFVARDSYVALAELCDMEGLGLPRIQRRGEPHPVELVRQREIMIDLLFKEARERFHADPKNQELLRKLAER